MKRYFTIDEVNHQVPRLEGLFGSIMQLRSQLKAIYARLDARGFAPSDEDFEPDAPGVPTELVKDRAAFKGLVAVLRAQVSEVIALGCEIKDVETGLVDWFSLTDRGEILLCWRFGEKQVAYFHDVDTGFAGRRPISELR